MPKRRQKQRDEMKILVDALDGYGLSADEIAQATGAVIHGTNAYDAHLPNPTQVLQRLSRLHEIAFLLNDTMVKSEVGVWFHESNQILRDYTPLQMIALGGYDQVLAAAAALVEGVDP